MVRPGQVPVKPPILVKLTAVVSPASFWAVALPLLDSGDDGGGDVAAVLEVESRLALLYGCDGTPVDEVLPATPTPLLLKPDTLVAARHHGGSFHWFRAQVLDLELSTGLASLFLIDQGYAIKVHPETCVRQLPDGMKTSPKPLAFQILLAGTSGCWDLVHACVQRPPPLIIRPFQDYLPYPWGQIWRSDRGSIGRLPCLGARPPRTP